MTQDVLDEKMAQTTDSFCSKVRAASLATPKAPGASERTKRRALSREYAAYAKEAAKALLPGVSATDLRLATFPCWMKGKWRAYEAHSIYECVSNRPYYSHIVAFDMLYCYTV